MDAERFDYQRQQEQDERREREEEERAWGKHWRETWKRWAEQHDKPKKEQNNEVV